MPARSACRKLRTAGSGGSWQRATCFSSIARKSSVTPLFTPRVTVRCLGTHEKYNVQIDLTFWHCTLYTCTCVSINIINVKHDKSNPNHLWLSFCNIIFGLKRQFQHNNFVLWCIHDLLFYKPRADCKVVFNTYEMVFKQYSIVLNPCCEW